MNIMYGINGHTDMEFWVWCFRHDLTQELRKAESFVTRLFLYRVCQCYVAMCRLGIPARWASRFAWSRVVRYKPAQPTSRRKRG